MERSLRHNESIRVRLAAPTFSQPDTRLNLRLSGRLLARSVARELISRSRERRSRGDEQAAKVRKLTTLDYRRSIHDKRRKGKPSRVESPRLSKLISRRELQAAVLTFVCEVHDRSGRKGSINCASARQWKINRIVRLCEKRDCRRRLSRAIITRPIF